MSKENKLTIEDAMKYPNASIIENKKVETQINYEFVNLVTFILWANENKEDNIFSYELCNMFLSDCKLILRSKDDMTEDEKLKELSFFHSQKAMGVGIGMNELWQSHLKGFDYLRSISVDIDGLEKQGVAVYENEGK